MGDEELSPTEKAKIASRLLLHAPPCQFFEVFRDVRVLVNDDQLMKEHISVTATQYNKEQLVQVKVPFSTDPSRHTVTLITKHGDLGSGRFLCPSTHETFEYDHLKRAASNVRADGATLSYAESLRVAVEKAYQNYVQEHYRNGVGVVYALEGGTSDWRLILCAEAEYFKNQTAGRWRSEWIVEMAKDPVGSSVKGNGSIKVQAHLFEQGNVQLLSVKEAEVQLTVGKSFDVFAQELVKKIEDAENHYQRSIAENFQELPHTSLKALRNVLPVTKAKIEWTKLSSYNIGEHLSRP
jgi:capping protein (actin filament) muscle Z-line, alpha